MYAFLFFYFKPIELKLLNSNNMKLYSAPLQGYTEAPWRNAHETAFGGVDAYSAPFMRIEKGDFRNKDLRDLSPANNQVQTLVPQLIAAAPDEMRRLIDQLVRMGYDVIDLNLGCPFPPLTNRHKGSGLLPYPEEVEALLQVMTEYPALRFSVKMRLGLQEPDEWKPLMSLLNQAPLERIVLHPRIGKQQYKGLVSLADFEAFYQACAHPLVYNGDLHTADDINHIMTRFPKLEGVMIGRGLLAQPWLATEYRTGKIMEESERRAGVKRMHQEILTHYLNTYKGGEAQVLSKIRTFWEYLLTDADKKLSKQIKKSNSMSAYLSAVGTY